MSKYVFNSSQIVGISCCLKLNYLQFICHLKSREKTIELSLFDPQCAVFTTECDNLQHPPSGAESYQILSIYDSFSSQTWAIFVPNRNFDLKSIQSSTKSPSVRYQNWGCLQNLLKIQEKITFSHKILMKSQFLKTDIVFTAFLRF